MASIYGRYKILRLRKTCCGLGLEEVVFKDAKQISEFDAFSINYTRSCYCQHTLAKESCP